MILTPRQIASLHQAAKEDPWKIGQMEFAPELAREMRAKCPIPGNDWDRLITVIMQKGNSLPEHKHKRHTMVYYPERDTDPISLEGRLYYPYQGEIIYIKPMLLHEVPPATKRRLSVVMQVR